MLVGISVQPELAAAGLPDNDNAEPLRPVRDDAEEEQMNRRL